MAFTVCTSPLSLSTPICALYPKCHVRVSHYDHLSFLIITQESSIRPPTATAALTSISTTMNETTVRQNCFLKNISKVSAYKRPQRGSMTSCSPFLWNPGNPRCFFDAGHILIKNGRKTSRNRTVEICFCRVSVFSRTRPKAVKNNLSRLLTRRNLRCIMSAF